MAAVGYVTKTISLKIDDTEYNCSINDAQLVPSQEVQKWTTGCPDGVGQDVGTVEWTLNLGIQQEWLTASSLVAVLNANAGKVALFSFTPQEGGVEITGECRLVAVTVGGTVNSPAASTAALPVLGAPDFIYPAAP